MLNMFDTGRKIIFFPIRWANSVTAWLTRVHSPSGTIRIGSKHNPDGSGPTMDLDVENAAIRLEGALETRFVSRAKASGVDSKSIILDSQGKLCISEEWLDVFVRSRIAPNAQIET